MTTLLIHPSSGRNDGRVNAKRSLHVPVDFSRSELARTLTSGQLGELRRRHPDGRARFWGTYQHNGDKIARVHEGDVVLFTGQGGAWAVGVVGHRFENPGFARSLWVETTGKGTYRHVYALARYQEVDIPYTDINRPLGFKPSNHFQGMAVYEGDRADTVIDALRIDITLQEDAAYEAADDDLAVELEEELQQAAPLSPVETVGSAWAVRRVDGGDRLVRRGEGRLVAAYAASLGRDVEYGRNFTTAGVSDLYIRHPDGDELIEAKSVETHLYVRQALAQLLDYAPAIQTDPEGSICSLSSKTDSAGNSTAPSIRHRLHLPHWSRNVPEVGSACLRKGTPRVRPAVVESVSPVGVEANSR